MTAFIPITSCQQCRFSKRFPPFFKEITLDYIQKYDWYCNKMEKDICYNQPNLEFISIPEFCPYKEKEQK